MEKSIEKQLTEVTAAQKIAKMNEHLTPAMQKIHPSVSFSNGKLEIQLQVGHPGEEGAISGCFGTHAVEAVLVLHQYYQNRLASRETALVITKLEEAWLWLKSGNLIGPHVAYCKLTSGKRYGKKVKEIMAIIDTREQMPLPLESFGLKWRRETLTHGDYSLAVPDLRKHVCIERKSLSDFISCCGVERDRFERELLAMRGYRYKAVVCEFSMARVLNHEYRSKITPHAVWASLARWMVEGITFILADNHQGAACVVSSMLKLIARDVIGYANKITDVEVASEDATIKTENGGADKELNPELSA